MHVGLKNHANLFIQLDFFHFFPLALLKRYVKEALYNYSVAKKMHRF